MKRISFTISLLTIFSLCSGQWQERNNGLYGGMVRAMLQRHDTIFTTSNGGVYRSVDSGRTWARFNKGIEWDVRIGHIFECQGEILISSSANHQYQLAADKHSWVRKLNALNSPELVQFAILGDVIFSRNNQGRIFRSDNLAASWQEITALPAQSTGLATDGTSLFLATPIGMFTSDIAATHWTEIPQVLPNKNFDFLRGADGYLIMGAGSHVYIKPPGQPLKSTGFFRDYSYEIFSDGENLFAASMSYTYHSADGGDTWHARHNFNRITSMLFPKEGEILAGTYYGVFRSNDGGSSWTDSSDGLANVQVNAILDYKNKFYLATGRGIYVSHDRGSSWRKTATQFGMLPMFAVIASDNAIVAAGEGIYVSRDGGDQWVKVFDSHITTLAMFKGSLYAASSYGLFQSADLGNSWRRVTPDPVQDVYVHDFRLWTCAWDDVRVSVDGTNWTAVNDGLIYFANPKEFFTFQGKLLLGTLNGVAYVLNEKSSSWEPLVPPGVSNLFMSFASIGSSLFMGSAHGVYVSTDSLKTFELANEGLPVYGNTNYVACMGVLDHTLFAGLHFFGMWSLKACPAIPPPEAIATRRSCDDVLLESSSESGNQWFREGIQIDGANAQKFQPKESGRYSVTTTKDGCMSDTSQPVEVIIASAPRIEMPNVFSPNNDNKNEAFRPIAFDGVDHATLSIYNRNGQKIYETTDLAKGWNGGQSSAAVYFYKIEYQPSCDRAMLKGWFHLIR